MPSPRFQCREASGGRGCPGSEHVRPFGPVHLSSRDREPARATVCVRNYRNTLMPCRRGARGCDQRARLTTATTASQRPAHDGDEGDKATKRHAAGPPDRRSRALLSTLPRCQGQRGQQRQRQRGLELQDRHFLAQLTCEGCSRDLSSSYKNLNGSSLRSRPLSPGAVREFGGGIKCESAPRAHKMAGTVSANKQVPFALSSDQIAALKETELGGLHGAGGPIPGLHLNWRPLYSNYFTGDILRCSHNLLIFLFVFEPPPSQHGLSGASLNKGIMGKPVKVCVTASLRVYGERRACARSGGQKTDNQRSFSP